MTYCYSFEFLNHFNMETSFSAVGVGKLRLVSQILPLPVFVNQLIHLLSPGLSSHRAFPFILHGRLLIHMTDVINEAQCSTFP